MTFPPHELVPLADEDDLQRTVARLGAEIARATNMSQLVIVGVLKGAAMFVSDLMRYLPSESQLTFVMLKSYEGMEPCAEPELVLDVDIDLKGKNVLVVEDIVDTGRSLAWLLQHLKAKGPRNLITCALLDKEERREAPVELDFAGYRLDKGFIVGYGLDWGQCYRGLPGLYEVRILESGERLTHT